MLPKSMKPAEVGYKAKVDLQISLTTMESEWSHLRKQTENVYIL